MHLFLWPLLLFGGLFKILIIVAVVVLIVRLVSRHGHSGYWHGHGHDHFSSTEQDPRRIAALRYAAGKIDRTEFDQIVSTLDASEAGVPTPPAAPTATPPAEPQA
jgi:uncharacterized membrane protein